MAEETIWSFGYGSNMDVKALEAKKHVKVIGKYLSSSSRSLLTVFLRFRTYTGNFERFQNDF